MSLVDPLQFESGGRSAPDVPVGIDLGTTNSLVACVRDGRADVLAGTGESPLLPSAVAYDAAGVAAVGAAARARLNAEPENVVVSVKRLMGRSAADAAALAGRLPYAVEGDAQSIARLVVAGRRVTPVEVSAEILSALRERAERVLGAPVVRAVVTVPAYFDDAARTATRDAARLAGLQVLRLLNEPTAAALAYGLDRGAEGIYAVYDLGGGTFDVSVLRLEEGVFQVLATGGDTQLGGDDFDRLLAGRLLEEHTGRVAPADWSRAVVAARALREGLSELDDMEVVLDLAGATTTHSLDRATFERLAEPLVERTLAIAASVLADAGITAAEVHGVVLVGGATRMPVVRRRVAALFGREPLVDLDPDAVVALGAALQADALTSGSDTLLLDVTPLSLGIETMGGLVERIVERNTPVPHVATQEFTTYEDGQTAILVHVVQGERELAADNRSLARFVLSGIPPAVAGAARIDVTFAIDADGILTVSARDAATAAERRVEVRPSYGLADDELQRLIEESYANARADRGKRRLIEARVAGRRMMLAIDAALAADRGLLTAMELRRIANAGGGLERAMAGEDAEAIEGWIERLDEESEFFAERRIEHGVRTNLVGRPIDVMTGEGAPGTKRGAG